MFNYLKWELIDYLKNKYKLLLFIIAVYIIFSLFPLQETADNTIQNLLIVLFSSIVFICLFGSFYIGTSRIVQSFSKDTFLLESMIPLSVKKILLLKYLIGIIINVIYLIIGLIGIWMCLAKLSNIEIAFDILKQFIGSFTVDSFLKVSISMFIATIAYMSVVVLCFVVSKVILPKSNSKYFGVIISFIALFIISSITNFKDISENLYLNWLIFSTIAIAAYFTTTLLIERKLEIYN